MSLARLHLGKVEDWLPELQAESFDACLCDPPYGLGFMGAKWDHGVPSAEVWAEVLRVLKPGASLLAFGGTRTYHRLACAIEDSGFEIRDSIGVPGLAWVYGSGMPKSLDISKALDRAAGAERVVVGTRPGRPGVSRDGANMGRGFARGLEGREDRPSPALDITAPATPEAQRWDGYGTSLKPAWEPVVWGMKPLAGTFANNAQQFGVAGVSIDATRIASAGESLAGGVISSRSEGWDRPWKGNAAAVAAAHERSSASLQKAEQLGRWPSNIILVHHPECEPTGTRTVKGDTRAGRPERGHRPGGFGDIGADHGSTLPNGALHGDQEVVCWSCHPACPVAEMDSQSGELSSGFMAAGTQREGIGYRGGLGSTVRHDTHGDTGGASRFFYQAKASPSERSGSKHPTLKPIDLCRYLAKLLLPPKREGAPRRLLVPFSGAGSEIIGALRAGWEEVVGIEMDPQWIADAERRIREDAPLLNRVEIVRPEALEVPA